MKIKNYIRRKKLLFLGGNTSCGKDYWNQHYSQDFHKPAYTDRCICGFKGPHGLTLNYYVGILGYGHPVVLGSCCIKPWI